VARHRERRGRGAGVQDPRASLAVLEVFSGLADIKIDFRQVREAGREVETTILELLEKMQEAARQRREEQERSKGQEYAGVCSRTQ
jgi:proteasome assembly chaperone (PAC2) family protein